MKFGLKSHMGKLGMDDPNYLNALLGKVSFGLYLNPNDNALRRIQSDLIRVNKEYYN